jgi:hypothetical protein
MTTYPVYDVSRTDYTRDCQPIGEAASEAEALTMLAKHFAGTGSAAPARVELNDRDTRGAQLWAYWPMWG